MFFRKAIKPKETIINNDTDLIKSSIKKKWLNALGKCLKIDQLEGNTDTLKKEKKEIKITLPILFPKKLSKPNRSVSPIVNAEEKRIKIIKYIPKTANLPKKLKKKKSNVKVLDDIKIENINDVSEITNNFQSTEKKFNFTIKQKGLGD